MKNKPFQRDTVSRNTLITDTHICDMVSVTYIIIRRFLTAGNPQNNKILSGLPVYFQLKIRNRIHFRFHNFADFFRDGFGIFKADQNVVV